MRPTIFTIMSSTCIMVLAGFMLFLLLDNRTPTTDGVDLAGAAPPDCPPVLDPAILAPGYIHDATRARQGSLNLTLTPWPGHYTPPFNETQLRQDAKRLLDVDLTIGPDGILLQHEKFPYTEQAGEWHIEHFTSRDATGAYHNFTFYALLTWNTTAPYEQVLLHEIGHIVGLVHVADPGLVMHRVAKASATGIHPCQTEALRHVFEEN